jgi:hypothetical protein
MVATRRRHIEMGFFPQTTLSWPAEVRAAQFAPHVEAIIALIGMPTPGENLGGPHSRAMTGYFLDGRVALRRR